MTVSVHGEKRLNAIEKRVGSSESDVSTFAWRIWRSLNCIRLPYIRMASVIVIRKVGNKVSSN